MSDLMRKPEREVGLVNPDRAGRVHRAHERFADVSTACGCTRIGLTWGVDPIPVPRGGLCARCFPAGPAAGGPP